MQRAIGSLMLVLLCVLQCSSYLLLNQAKLSKVKRIPLRMSSPEPIGVNINEKFNFKNKELSESSNFLSRAADQLKIIWDFTRPHTIVGSAVSIISLFLYATPASMWKTSLFWNSLLESLIPSLFMNLYITGLNQVTDVEIDKINKPYLPIASGKLSKSNGTLIIIASLIASLINVKNVDWPLQLTLLGSAILGTVYSLPPFRLKRFPLLAAFCILVVRGSLVNMGFFLQAKASVLSLKTVPTLASIWKMFPESVVLTSFFAVFGLVIALMKDVPDIRGDVLFKIPSFSVKLGAKKMFRAAWGLLFFLLSTSSVLSLFSSQVFNKYLGNILTIPVSKQLNRVCLSIVLGLFALDVKKRAEKVEAENPDKVFSYYMHIWNIFYACYLILPLARS